MPSSEIKNKKILDKKDVALNYLNGDLSSADTNETHMKVSCFSNTSKISNLNTEINQVTIIDDKVELLE